ncbi:helix-turn-helix domain-containing protein [Nocardia sp. CC201C]|uniref:helix-turn-helix domain-containing protein n=1 Tax=Nocardia sp. CC201C TaxID=3044575 RepID=UPI0024A904AF|nr:helix-turn-helix domain-containing protein [Nocardia sp. CC201C]
MEQLDVLVAEQVRRVAAQLGRDSDDLARCLGLSREELRLLLAARRSFTLEHLVRIADALGCSVEELIPDVEASAEYPGARAECRSMGCEANHSHGACDICHGAGPAEIPLTRNISVNAQHALSDAVESLPRLTGFDPWRSAVPGLPYLSGDEPNAVAVIVIHDPRDGRVCSATLIASPDGSAATR